MGTVYPARPNKMPCMPLQMYSVYLPVIYYSRLCIILIGQYAIDRVWLGIYIFALFARIIHNGYSVSSLGRVIFRAILPNRPGQLHCIRSVERLDDTV